MFYNLLPHLEKKKELQKIIADSLSISYYPMVRLVNISLTFPQFFTAFYAEVRNFIYFILLRLTFFLFSFDKVYVNNKKKCISLKF